MTVQCTQAFNPAARLRLGASAWHEAPNLRCAIAVLVRPDYRWPKTVGLGYNGVVRHNEPLAIDSYTIVSILGVPVDILHTEAVLAGASPARPTKRLEAPLSCKVAL